MNRARIATSVFLLAMVAARPALAQVDLFGEWQARMHEDFWHRMAGPEIGDYTGVPINDDARLVADTFDASIWSQKGYQCRPHQAPYAMRGPANMRIEKLVDPSVDRLIAYEIYGTYARSPRMIWMDGRPHPPEYARHLWSGFSTGKWEGDMLTVTTTHLRKGYIQRNGIDSSDQTTLVEHFFRFGDGGQYLMLVTEIYDPIYLEEPFVRTTNWVLATNQVINNSPGGAGPGVLNGPCGAAQTTDEVAGMARDYVPHHLPGTNTQLHEVSEKYGIPYEATRGGAETTYPEYQKKLKEWLARDVARKAAAHPATGSTANTGIFGTWRLNRAKSSFTENKRRAGPLGLDATTVEWRTMKFEAVGDAVKHTTDTRAVANDTGFFREEYTAQFDGKDNPIKIKSTALDSVALKRIDANTIERTGKIGSQVAETATWKLSDNGRVLTVTSKGNTEGVEYTSVQVFERQ
jgi:hypothetical protein